MTIERSNPDIGYLDPDRLRTLGVSQVVVAGGQVHWSGIVAATGGGTTLVCHSPGDVDGQLARILATLDECLASAGTDRTRIVSLTMFTTDMDGLSAALKPAYSPWVGDHRPTLTCIGVERLAYPDLALEVQGFAMLPGN